MEDTSPEDEKFEGISYKQFVKEYNFGEFLGAGVHSDVYKIKKKVLFIIFLFLIDFYWLIRRIYESSDLKV
jgi:hypothetical protein